MRCELAIQVTVQSVKTGYQLLEEFENRGDASGSSSSNLRSFWKGIWKMRIPNKIKNFCWRACTESLPTLANLHRRNVVNSPVCNSCGSNRETVLHALWDCAQSQCCWTRGFNSFKQTQMHLGSFSDLLTAVKQSDEDVELFTVVAWLVWCRRNKRHFKEQCLPPEKIVDTAETILKEFQAKPKNMPLRTQPQSQRWTPPEPGMYKANFDGAYFAEEEAAGIGVVVRNELGQVMASLAEKIVMPQTVEILEALAARRAMIFMEELGLGRVIFEGDSENVVKALTGGCPDRSSIGHIVKDCMSFMGWFQSCSFSHVRRQGNGVAHALARRARNSSPLSVWMESVQPDISYLVYVDVTT